MAHYFRDSSGEIRFWHPVEILLLHSVVGKFFIPSDWNLAWKYLGNQICPPHALLLLANAIRMMPSRVGNISVAKLFQSLHETRLTVGNSFLLNTAWGMIVSPDHLTLSEGDLASMKDFEDFAKEGKLPPGHFWTLRGHGTWAASDLFLQDSLLVITPEDIEPEEFDPAETSLVHSPVSHPEVEDSPVSPTCRFSPLLKGVIHLVHRKVDFWFSAALPFEKVLAVWGHQFAISLDHATGLDVALHLVPAGNHCLVESTVTGVICLLQEGHLTLFEDSEAARSQALQDDSYFKVDQFGKIEQSCFDSSMIIFKELNPSLFQLGPCDPLMIFAAFSQVLVQNRFNSDYHSWTLEFRGSQVATDAMGRFWGNLFSQLDLGRLGWKVTCRDSSSDPQGHVVTICFEPDIRGYLVPLPAFQVLITTAAFRALVSSMSLSCGIRTTIKWLSRPLMTVNLPENTGLSMLTRAHCIALCTDSDASCEFRLVNAGKQITPECCIRDCTSINGKLIIHLVPPLHGGGVEQKGSKAGFQTQIRNSIASSLLQEGYDLQWVSQKVDQLFEKVGAKKLAPFAAQPPGSQRLDDILSQIRSLGVEIPPIKPHLSSSNAFQSKIRKKIVTFA